MAVGDIAEWLFGNSVYAPQLIVSQAASNVDMDLRYARPTARWRALAAR